MAAIVGRPCCAGVLLLAVIVGAGSVKPPHLVKFSEEFVTATGAKCLDGSPAGYYIRVQDPKRWVVYLEGGGLCVEQIDCIMRARGDLGSSKGWTQDYEDAEGFPFATRHAAAFGSFSQVLVPYCSGDMWAGTDQKGRWMLGGLQMSGHSILTAALDHLFSNTSFSMAEEVIFSGASAGGFGVIQHTDWIRNRLQELRKSSNAPAAPVPRVTSIPLAGLFFPEGWPVLFEEFVLGSIKPRDSFMSWWVATLEGGFMHEGCLAAAKANGTAVKDCFDVSKVLPFVQGDLFIVQNLFDQLQIHDLGLCPPSSCHGVSDAPSSRGGKFIRYMGQCVQKTMSQLAVQQPNVGFYVAAKFQHDGNLAHYLEGKPYTIDGLTLKAALERWNANGQRVHLIADTCNEGGPCTHGDDNYANASVPASVPVIV